MPISNEELQAVGLERPNFATEAANFTKAGGKELREDSETWLDSVTSTVGDVAEGAVSGLSKATSNVGENVRDFGGLLGENTETPTWGADPFIKIGSALEWAGDYISVEPPDSIPGQFTESVTQFLTTFLPVNRVLKTMGIAGGAAQFFGRTWTAGALADVLSFDESQARLSNLIEEYPMLSNPVTAFLAADPDDEKAVAKFKQGLEGLLMGPLADGLISGVRVLAKAAIMRGGAQAGAGSVAKAPPAFTPMDRSSPGQLHPWSVETADDITKAMPTGSTERVTDVHADIGMNFANRDADIAVSDVNVLTTKFKHTSLFKPHTQAEKEMLAQDPKFAAAERKRMQATRRHVAVILTETRERLARLKDIHTYMRTLVEASDQVFVEGQQVLRQLIDNEMKYAAESGRNLGLISGEITPEAHKYLTAIHERVVEARRQVLASEANIAPMRARLAPFRAVQEALGLKEIRDLPLHQLEWVRDQIKLSRDVLNKMAKLDLNDPLNRLDFAKQIALHMNLLDRVSPNISNSATRLTHLATKGMKDEQVRALGELVKKNYSVNLDELSKAINNFDNPDQINGAMRHLHKLMADNADGALFNKGSSFPNATPAPAHMVGASASHAKAGKFFKSAIYTAPRASKNFRDALQRAIVETYVMGLFSGPKTQLANIAGNSLVMAWAPVERLGAAMIPGSPVQFGEVTASLYGMVMGSKEGLILAARTAKTGQESFLPSAKIDFDKGPRAIRATEFGLSNDGFLGMGINALGSIVGLPGRGLLTADQFFKAVAYRMNIQQQAWREANRKGLTGKAFWEDMEKNIHAPTTTLDIASAEAFALEQTFTNNLGTILGPGLAFLDKHPMLRIMLPVVRTPTNILKFVAKRSPVGLLSKQFWADMRAGGEQRATALSRMALGTTLGMVGVSLWGEGVITGSGPADPAENAFWREENQPYSVRIGDKWVSFENLSPIGDFLKFGAKAAEAIHYGDTLSETSTEIAAGLVMTMMGMASESYLLTVGDFIDAVQMSSKGDIDGAMDKLSRLGSNVASNFVPAIVRDTERVMDPTLPVMDNWLDGVRANIPGLSADLPARVNFWGEVRKASERFGPNWASPLLEHTATDSPASRELVRLGLGLRMPTRTIDGVSLTAEQHNELIRIRGQDVIAGTGNLRETLDALVQSPEYLTTPGDEYKADIIRGVVNGFTGAARGLLIAKDANIRGAIAARGTVE